MTHTPESSSDRTGVTRRRLLGGGAAAGGLAGLASALPPNLARAVAEAPAHRPGSLRDIEHVVLLMQENRSFDHYFGTLSGVRGFEDRHAMRLPNGQSVFHQPDPDNPDGYLMPFRLNSRQTAAQAIPSTSHAWSVQHSAWNGGRMDNWLPAHRAADGQTNGPYTMGYFTRQDIPFHYALADAFTICDAYHCSVLGPTQPNRYMWFSGTIDPDGRAGGPVLDNNAPADVYSWTTYAERLEAAGVSWRVYHEAGGTTGLAPITKMRQYNHATPGTPLYDKAVAPCATGQFEYDAVNGTLPTVSWILPPSACDEHPANLPAAGAQFVASKLDALAANPETWAKTVFILSYDENDGLFDHVAPPTPPAGTTGEFVTRTSSTGVAGAGLPTGLGFRVPCLIVSPRTVGGWVCSELFDHTSQLRFLERVTGVRETNISDWRRRTVGDLTSALGLLHGSRTAPTLPDTAGAYNLAKYEVANLPKPAAPIGRQVPPTQERGVRPRIR